MLFNSFEYLLFLPLVFCLYWFVFNRKVSWQNGFLLLASYIFYAWWSPKFLSLLAFSTFLDYMYGFSVASPNRKKAKLFLWLSIINNLGVLAIFKYYNFFATEFQHAMELFGYDPHPILLHLVLPIGISFYTFHGMSYVFDIYNGRQKPVSNFVDYAVFVSFFPLLVAGPIERANHLLPQVQAKRVFNYTQAVNGCKLILWGFFKKVIIADNLAMIADNAFKDYPDASAATLIIGAIAFSFQIYGDFSGYTDIALGSAKLMGFELLTNFKFPYFSRNIGEFWRRWHISLSSWFRDYLYIPLGGSREGRLKAIRNTFIIFLVSGFWHGANWTFIVWGGIHACMFLPLLVTNNNRKFVSNVVAQDRVFPTIKEWVQILTTFTFVTIAWVFFRSHTVAEAVGYLKAIVMSIYHHPAALLSKPEGLKALYYIIPLILLDWWFRKDERQLRPLPGPRWVRYTVYVLLFLFIIDGLIVIQNKSFIYFQF